MGLITKEPSQPIITRVIAAYIASRGGHPVEPGILDTFKYWEGLFMEYNKAMLAKGDRILHMTCRPCYTKVYLWAQKESEGWKERTMDELEAKAKEEFKKSTWLNNLEEDA